MNNLVLGHGLLGSEIVKQTGWDFFSRKKDNFDFRLLSSYKDKLEKYDTIINCVALTDTYSSNKFDMYDVNFKSVTILSDYLTEKNKKLIHISTDYVYTNSKNYASEEDLPLISENWYTYYKLLADEYIMLKNKNFAIFRCSFKPNPFPYPNAWINQVGNFDYVDTISKILIQLINLNVSGLYNVGTGVKSIYELAKKTNPNVMGVLKSSSSPSNITINIDKMKKVL